MSRTDVHRPWHVQINDPYNRHILYRYPGLYSEMMVTSFKNIGCGCALCTGTFFRRHARRQERVQWRTAKRDILKCQAADREHIDVPLIRGNAW